MKKILFPLLLAVAAWAVVLLVPSLRNLCMHQILGSSRIRFSALPAPQFSENYWHNVALRFPGDPAVQAYVLDEQLYPVPDYTLYAFDDDYEERPPISSKLISRYDKLIQKHPDNVWLIARRLRLALGYFRHDRVGGEMSDPKFEENQKKGIPSPERNKEVRLNLSPAQIQTTLNLCKQGQKFEPNNAFFNWIEIQFLLATWKDDDAWRSLDAAARKTAWNSHDWEDIQNAAAALEKIHGRPLLREEKNLLINGLSFEVLTRYRESGRIISWQAIKAQRAGDHKQVLRLTSGLAHMMKRMREGSKMYIEGLVAIAIEQIAYNGVSYDLRRTRKNPGTGNIQQQRASGFRQYALQNGRPDLALEVDAESQKTAAYRQALKNAQSNNTPPLWHSLLTNFLWIAGVVLLLAMPFVSLFLVIATIILISERTRKFFGIKEMGNTVPTREVAGGVIFCAGITPLAGTLLALLAVFLFSFPALWIFSFAQGLYVGPGLPPGDFWKDQFQSLASSETSWSWTEWLSSNGAMFSELSTGLRGFVALWVVALISLHSIRCALAWQLKCNGENIFRLRDTFMEISKGHIFEIDYKVRSLIGRLCEWFLFTAFIFSCLAMLGLEALRLDVPLDLNEHATQNWFTTFKTIALVTATILFCSRWVSWRRRPRRRQAAGYALLLGKRTAIALFLTIGPLYCLLLIASLFLRQSEDREFDDTLRYGEVPYAFMQKPAAPTPTN